MTQLALDKAQELKVNIEKRLYEDGGFIFYDWILDIRNWLYLTDQIISFLEETQEDYDSMDPGQYDNPYP